MGDEGTRQRIDLMLGEFRMVIPLVGVLIGFQLTVPFQQAWASLPQRLQVANLLALLASMLSLLFLLVPVMYHRYTRRFDDSEAFIAFARRNVALAFLFLPLSLALSFLVQAARVLSQRNSVLLAALLMLAMLVAWWVVPRARAHQLGHR